MRLHPEAGPDQLRATRAVRSRSGELVGVPYRSIARLILLYLQTEAVRTNTTEIELAGP